MTRRANQIVLRDFLGNISGIKRSLLLLLVFILIYNATAVLAPLLMQFVVDGVIVSGDYQLLLIVSGCFVGIFLLQFLVQLFRQFYLTQLAAELRKNLDPAVLSHLLHLPISYYSARSLGEIHTNFTALRQIHSVITVSYVAMIIEFLMMIGVAMVMLSYSGALCSIVIIGTGCTYLLQLMMAPKAKKLLDVTFDAMSKFASNFFETIKSHRLIKIGELEEERLERWKKFYNHYLDADMKRERILALSRNLQELITNLEFILSFVFGSSLVINGQLSIGMFFAFVAFRQRFISSSKLLIDALLQIQMLDVNLDKLSNIVLEPKESRFAIPEVETRPKDAFGDRSAVNGANGLLEVANVSFRYPGSHLIFSNLDFYISPGETVAIVGPSGCGKTTLILCLMGLLKPDSGEILIDGISIFETPNYRKLATAILQDDHLLAGSIKDNICSFAGECDFELVQRCANLAQVHEEIVCMPLGYDSMISDMGAGLSGGQKQRIIIARALYRKPRILFWDEATSQVDLHNEARINANIKKLGISRVIVSHRPQPSDEIDRVVNLSRPVIGFPAKQTALV